MKGFSAFAAAAAQHRAAIAVGCRKCPVVAVCPLKSVIGDYRKDDADKPKTASPGKPSKPSK